MWETEETKALHIDSNANERANRNMGGFQECVLFGFGCLLDLNEECAHFEIARFAGVAIQQNVRHNPTHKYDAERQQTVLCRVKSQVQSEWSGWLASNEARK